MGRKLGGIHPGSVPDRTLDLLSIDGGWLTVQGIALDLSAKQPTVEKALWRLRRRGRVQSRWRDSALEWRANTSQFVIPASYGEFDDVG